MVRSERESRINQSKALVLRYLIRQSAYHGEKKQGKYHPLIFSSSNPGGKVPALIPKIATALNHGGLFINKQGIDDLTEDPFLSLEWNLWTFEGIQKQGRRYVFSNSVSLEDYNGQLSEYGFEIRQVLPIDDQSALTIARKK